jgi:hypothetical protein
MMKKIPVVVHDDGIFRMPQEQAYGQASVAEFARRVLQDYAAKEYKRILPLRNSWKPADGKVLKAHWDFKLKTAGQIFSAPTQLYLFSTKQEHQHARRLASFFEHPIPVEGDQKPQNSIHSDHYWKMALLNAYRIFDMMGDGSVKLPHGWERVQIKPGMKNYASLLASAAYQMGKFHAMALALAQVHVVKRGKQMSGGNKGNLSEFRKLVEKACKEIISRYGKIPKRKASLAVMEVLEKNGHASTKDGIWLIFTSKGEEDVDFKKLSKFINLYREQINIG